MLRLSGPSPGKAPRRRWPRRAFGPAFKPGRPGNAPPRSSPATGGPPAEEVRCVPPTSLKCGPAVGRRRGEDSGLRPRAAGGLGASATHRPVHASARFCDPGAGEQLARFDVAQCLDLRLQLGESDTPRSAGAGGGRCVRHGTAATAAGRWGVVPLEGDLGERPDRSPQRRCLSPAVAGGRRRLWGGWVEPGVDAAATSRRVRRPSPAAARRSALSGRAPARASRDDLQAEVSPRCPASRRGRRARRRCAVSPPPTVKRFPRHPWSVGLAGGGRRRPGSAALHRSTVSPTVDVAGGAGAELQEAPSRGRS